MRAATEADRPAILAALTDRRLVSVFPLANLEAHGWDSDAPRAMRFWLSGDGDAILGVTTAGMLLTSAARPDFAGARAALAGRRLIGAAGEAGMVEALLAELALADAPCRLRESETQMALDLADLVVPEGSGEIVPLGDIARDVAERWRADYEVETLGADPAEGPALAAEAVENMLKQDSHRVLMIGGQPVSLTGVNARARDLVQLGGIWTPPEHRRKGHAARAIGLHLAEMQKGGALHATLFTSSPGAQALYASLGFREFGRFALVLFREPVPVAPLKLGAA